MSELEREELDGKPPLEEEDDTDDAADLISMVKTNEKGEQVIGLGQYIEKRKEMKAQKRELKELRAQVENYKGIDERLQKVLPIAEAVEKDPQLAKDIQAALNGTRRSQPATDQPHEDAEALEYAQIHNLVTKDKEGSDVWDVARATRALEIEAARSEKRMKPHIDAANAAAFGMRGEQNLTAMYGLTTKDGEPLASEESIKQILQESQMPMQSLADPRVAKTVARMAAGLDRELGRTPKAPIEPLFFERAGGRRGESSQVISDSERRLARQVGVSEQELATASKAKPNRKGEIDLE